MGLFFIVGILISGFLGVRGLIRGEIELTYETTLTGKSAKLASWMCIAFSLLMIALLVWVLTWGLGP
jgi:hypothetical protein